MNPSEKEFQMFIEGFRQGKEHGYQCGKANLDTLSKDYKISQALYEKEATKLTKIAFDLIAEIRYNDEAENNRNKDCGCCGANLAAADYVEDLLHLAGRYDEAAVLEPILLDLIAELRDAHYNDQCGCGCEQWYECKPCLHVGLCPSQEAAVRAEQRLREVSDE